MIVRTGTDSVQLIGQPDHARLARRIMERAVSLAAHPRRETILYAIEHHDDGWAEFDAAPTVDPATGDVVDFVHVPAGVRQAVLPRSAALVRDDPWAAALIVQHALTVYERFRADAAWHSYFAEMTSARTSLLDDSHLHLDDLVTEYAFLRLADLISLAFCTGWSEESRFGAWSVRSDGSRVIVEPDIFGGAEIPFEVSAKEIRRRHFGSDAELRAALAAATPMTLRGEVSGPPMNPD
jgi:hypothetical protein